MGATVSGEFIEVPLLGAPEDRPGVSLTLDWLGKPPSVALPHAGTTAPPPCTPGRAALITGQYPIRTGLTTVGMAGSPIGFDKRDPTLAEVLKPLGYRYG